MPANRVAPGAQPLPKMSDEFAVLAPEVQKVLPPHIPVEKYMRTVRTAVATEPRLAQADRRSLLIAAIKCALDGLMPDGKEAAFVVYRTKERNSNRYIDKVQYMPMVAGILKKVRNSGELLDLTAVCVYQADEFRFWVDDEGEHVNFAMNLDVSDRGGLRAVFARARTKNGGVYVEVMTVAEIEAVRAISRAANDGPWVTWYSEMARKTAIRRLSKRLPMSTDIERVIKRDDELYNVDVRQAHTAATGLAATRAMLGLSDSEPPSPDEAPQARTWTDADAHQALSHAASIAELQSLWAEISSSFIDSDRQLPVAIEAAFNDRLEALKHEAEADA